MMFSDVSVEDSPAEDERHVTLAIALEEARSARDTSLKVKNEMLAELERFRLEVRSELKARKRKLDAHDYLAVVGLGMLAGGVAVAFHWAYSLIIVGTTVMGIAIVPLMRRPVKT